MTWQGNPRTTTRAHRALRMFVLKRDQHQCYKCGNHANEIDAVICEAEGGKHTPENCRAICNPCHRIKSSAEGGRARARNTPNRATSRRPPEPHPGIKR